MTTRDFKRVHFLLCEIICLLSLADAGCRFECNTEGYRGSICNAAVYSAGPVFSRAAIRTDGVIMLRALHCRCLESVSEFYSAHSRYGKHSMCKLRLHTIPERFSISRVNTWNGAFHYRTKAVSFLYGLVYGLFPLLRKRFLHWFQSVGMTISHSCLPKSILYHVGRSRDISQPDSTQFNDPCTDIIARCLIEHCKVGEYFLSHYTRCDYRKRKSAGKMSSATRILTVIPFKGGCQVRMTGTRHCRKKTVIGRMRIGIPEHYGKRRSRSVPLKHSADNLRLVGLDSRRSTFRSAFAPEYIVFEVLLREFQSGRNAVQNHSYQLTM